MSIDFRTTLNTKIIASKQINHMFEAKNEIIDVYLYHNYIINQQFSISESKSHQNNSTIVYNDQEEDKFHFYSNDSLSDSFTLSSAYSQLFIPNTSYALLYSFDGEIVQYDYVNHTIKHSKQIKNTYNAITLEDTQGNISNPPYLSKMIYNHYSNELICGMMDGVAVSLTALSLNKKKVKTIHNGSINDIKMCRFTIGNNDKGEVISFGNDHCLKLFNGKSFEVDYYFDIEERVIDFETDKDMNIYYIDSNSECLYVIKFDY